LAFHMLVYIFINIYHTTAFFGRDPMWFRLPYGSGYVISREEGMEEGLREAALLRQQVQRDFDPPIQLRMT